ncbi:MAG: hypothetical protein HY308_03130 [Gammaproteobacteria bacterium]|nr:hypothetical protein [Gammaproteobacteria bacterium]
MKSLGDVLALHEARFDASPNAELTHDLLGGAAVRGGTGARTVDSSTLAHLLLFQHLLPSRELII